MSELSPIRFVAAPAVHPSKWAAVLAFSWLLIGAIGGCGGSSSETPFPLEPDPRLLKPAAAASSRYVVLPGKSREQEPEPAESEPLPERPTWGGSKSENKPTPAPSEAE